MNERPPHDRDASARPHGPPPIAEHVKSRETWLRLFFMLVMVLLYGVAEFVMAVVVLVQFFVVLFTGTPNPNLLEFGRSLALYTYQIFIYLTFNSEERPFPFDRDWPDPDEPA